MRGGSTGLFASYNNITGAILGKISGAAGQQLQLQLQLSDELPEVV